MRTPPGFRARTGPPEEMGATRREARLSPRAPRSPAPGSPPEGAPPTPTPPGGFRGRAHLGCGAKVSGVGVRMGAKARAPPTRPRRDSAGAEGGSLEPPGRSASGAGGLFGQKVLREQLLRPPSAPSLGDAPPPAFTGRKATPLRPRPRSRDPRRRAPAPPTAIGSASGARASTRARALPFLFLDSRARTRLSSSPPPARRLDVARARPLQ